MSYSDIEQMQRRLEEGLNRSLQLLEDLEIGIGDVQQATRLLRQSGGGGAPPCTGSIDVTVRDCSNVVISGAVVTVKDSLGATVGSGTTGAPGTVSVSITAAGTYTVVVAKTGQATATVSVTATCTANAVTVQLGRVFSVRVFTQCSLNLPGLTVTATLGGVSYSGITNGIGQVLIPVQANGTYTITITGQHARFAAYSASVSMPSCTQVIHNPVLPAATGYAVFCGLAVGEVSGQQCLIPVPTTLNLTDSVYGACALTFNSLSGTWDGTKSVSYAGCASPSCPAKTVDVTYSLAQNTFGGTGQNLQISYKQVSLCPDPAGASTVAGLASIGTKSCPMAFSLSLTINAGTNAKARLYCGTAATFTITE